MQDKKLLLTLYPGLFLMVIMVFCFNHLSAQHEKQMDTNAIKTIDGIVDETLAFISGKSESSYNWEAFRLLFKPTAQFMYLSHGKNGQKQLHKLNLEEFVSLGMKTYEQSGFTEYELKKTIDKYNGIAHVFQSYEANGSFGTERGMNSYQLVFDGERWWITSILWTDNKNGTPIPANYQ